MPRPVLGTTRQITAVIPSTGGHDLGGLRGRRRRAVREHRRRRDQDFRHGERLSLVEVSLVETLDRRVPTPAINVRPRCTPSCAIDLICSGLRDGKPKPGWTVRATDTRDRRGAGEPAGEEVALPGRATNPGRFVRQGVSRAGRAVARYFETPRSGGVDAGKVASG